MLIIVVPVSYTHLLPITASQQRGRELFALTVQGESMKNAGILDGDYVVVERTPTARDGDIVVALIAVSYTHLDVYKRQADTCPVLEG